MISLTPPRINRMMDRWMKKMERMRKNKVAARQGWKDIITDFIIIKKGG